MTFDIHIHTQYLENYGDEVAPYWKYKGGETYVVTGFDAPLTDRIGQAGQAVVDRLRGEVEYANPYSQVFIIDWEFVPAGSLTKDEELAMRYDGRVDFPSPRLSAVPQPVAA